MPKKKSATNQAVLPFMQETVEDRVQHNHVHVRKSTFLAGLSASVHRWFRLTPSYGPDLVQKMLADMETDSSHAILDPFSGAGTTVIESKMEGLRCFGFEINPLLRFVCDTSTKWDIPLPRLQDDFRQIRERFQAERTRLSKTEIEEIGIPLPTIHNVFRWWRKDVLKDLLILRAAIDSATSEISSREFFHLGFAGVLVPDLTNVTLGRLQLFFIDRSDHEMNVWSTYEAHVTHMLDDYAAIPDECRSAASEIIWGDSTTDDVLGVPVKINRVITSPPYPNRYSYVWNTRPHLYMLDLFQNAKQASTLDLKTIGGTWGTATSRLMKGRIDPAFRVIETEVMPIAEEIRKDDNLMANYMVHYFNKLAQQIVSQNRILADDAKCAYVVGCSRLKGVYVEKDVLLGKIFEGLDLGFHVDRVERIRKRHSGKDLHESIVYVSR